MYIQPFQYTSLSCWWHLKGETTLHTCPELGILVVPEPLRLSQNCIPLQLQLLFYGIFTGLNMHGYVRFFLLFLTVKRTTDRGYSHHLQVCRFFWVLRSCHSFVMKDWSYHISMGLVGKWKICPMLSTDHAGPMTIFNDLSNRNFTGPSGR